MQLIFMITKDQLDVFVCNSIKISTVHLLDCFRWANVCNRSWCLWWWATIEEFQLFQTGTNSSPGSRQFPARKIPSTKVNSNLLFINETGHLSWWTKVCFLARKIPSTKVNCISVFIFKLAILLGSFGAQNIPSLNYFR